MGSINVEKGLRKKFRPWAWKKLNVIDYSEKGIEDQNNKKKNKFH